MNFKEHYLFELSQSAIKKAIAKFVKAGQEEEEITNLVNSFNDLSQKNKIKSVDIFAITYEELKELVYDAVEKETRKEKDDAIKDNETEVILDNDKVLVVSPQTHRSSCKYGANTKWCTTERNSNHWDGYYRKGIKFYYIIPKNQDDDDPYAQKVAVAVYPNEKKEIYDEEDNLMSQSNFEEFLRNLDIDNEIFEPLDEDDILERIEITDYEAEDLAATTVHNIGITMTSDPEFYDDAITSVKDQIQSRFTGYDSWSGQDDLPDLLAIAQDETGSWDSYFEDALEKLQDKYGIDAESTHNKMELIGYISDADNLVYEIEHGDDYFDKEDIFKHFDWKFLSDRSLESLLDALEIGFADPDGLDEKEIEQLEKWLSHHYQKKDKEFENFLDNVMEYAEKNIDPTDKVSDKVKEQLVELIDKVSKVEYGKSGHPKLDLQHVGFDAFYYMDESIKSLKDKVGEMNGLGLYIANKLDKDRSLARKLTTKQLDMVYEVADGMAEEFVMKNIEGRTSMAVRIKWPPVKLEKYVDDKIKELRRYIQKL